MYEMSGDAKSEHERERQELAEARAREEVERAEDQVREHSERAQKQVARALEKVAEAEDKAGEKVAEALKRAERGPVDAPAADDVEPLVWFREEPTSRRPAHSRVDIARAAIEIADSEGFDSVSMRRVAQRLGAGTMTLYHYVRNKDELITLMSDAVMAEVVVPEGELANDWRAALTQIAMRTRDAFSAHHWVFELMGDGRPGPSGMRHFEQSLRAVASLGLDRQETFELIGQIDDYVFGFSLREIQEREEHERGWPPEVIDFFERELASGDYPLISEFLGSDIEESIDFVMDFLAQPGRFERGLKRLLDGIEAELLTKPPK
jgi:AcrR family transcriptional regulator